MNSHSAHVCWVRNLCLLKCSKAIGKFTHPTAQLWPMQLTVVELQCSALCVCVCVRAYSARIICAKGAHSFKTLKKLHFRSCFVLILSSSCFVLRFHFRYYYTLDWINRSKVMTFARYTINFTLFYPGNSSCRDIQTIHSASNCTYSFGLLHAYRKCQTEQK